MKGKRYFDYPSKYYAEDTGLRNARLDFRDTDPSHAMENAIYNELVRRGCTVDVGVVPIVSLNSDGRQELRYHEIDFVVNRAPANCTYRARSPCRYRTRTTRNFSHSGEAETFSGG